MNGITWTGLALLGLVGTRAVLDRWGSRGVVRRGRSAPGSETLTLKHHLEYVDSSENSDKFWEIWDIGSPVQVEVRWGRRGSKGQKQRTTWTEAMKRRDEKLHKGYYETEV